LVSHAYGAHFLNGFDDLFDDDSGHVGFRWTGHVHEHLAAVSVARDGAGPGLTQGQR